jgi:microcystin-dependent protein
MSCQNCFNGCADIISDKCIKYTGAQVPELDINNGDTLLSVENKITNKIVELMNGSGIIPTILPGDVCDIVQSFMPCCPPFDLNVILTVIIKTICDIDSRLVALKDRVIVVEDILIALNADYDIQCLEGVDVDTDTHDIVQSIIYKLCLLEADLHTNYSSNGTELDEYIANYLTINQPTNLVSNKMIPYVAVPFFDPNALDYFSSSGAGLDLSGSGGLNWTNIFLCNGQNPGVPDLRGRTLVGVTSMPSPPISGPTQPGVDGTPDYTLLHTEGSSTVTLDDTQVPSHTHIATSTPSGLMNTQVPFVQQVSYPFSPPGPVLTYQSVGNDKGASRVLESNTINPAGLIITTNVLPSTQGNGPHPNIQPSIGAYYIIYIPA